MFECKARATPEQKERSRNQRASVPNSSGRADTWTDRSEPVYDRHGNQVGTFNNPNRYYENDRR